MFRVFTTDEFDKDLAKLDTSEQVRVKKILGQLQQQGANVGKPLSGLSFFREKKFDGKRLYFLAYKEFLIILVIAISGKKAQQATINSILTDLIQYQSRIFDLAGKK